MNKKEKKAKQAPKKSFLLEYLLCGTLALGTLFGIGIATGEKIRQALFPKPCLEERLTTKHSLEKIVNSFKSSEKITYSYPVPLNFILARGLSNKLIQEVQKELQKYQDPSQRYTLTDFKGVNENIIELAKLSQEELNFLKSLYDTITSEFSNFIGSNYTKPEICESNCKLYTGVCPKIHFIKSIEEKVKGEALLKSQQQKLLVPVSFSIDHDITAGLDKRTFQKGKIVERYVVISLRKPIDVFCSLITEPLHFSLAGLTDSRMDKLMKKPQKELYTHLAEEERLVLMEEAAVHLLAFEWLSKEYHKYGFKPKDINEVEAMLLNDPQYRLLKPLYQTYKALNLTPKQLLEIFISEDYNKLF